MQLFANYQRLRYSNDKKINRIFNFGFIAHAFNGD